MTTPAQARRGKCKYFTKPTGLMSRALLAEEDPLRIPQDSPLWWRYDMLLKESWEQTGTDYGEIEISNGELAALWGISEVATRKALQQMRELQLIHTRQVGQTGREIKLLFAWRQGKDGLEDINAASAGVPHLEAQVPATGVARQTDRGNSAPSRPVQGAKQTNTLKQEPNAVAVVHILPGSNQNVPAQQLQQVILGTCAEGARQTTTLEGEGRKLATAQQEGAKQMTTLDGEASAANRSGIAVFRNLRVNGSNLLKLAATVDYERAVRWSRWVTWALQNPNQTTVDDPVRVMIAALLIDPQSEPDHLADDQFEELENVASDEHTDLATNTGVEDLLHSHWARVLNLMSRVLNKPDYSRVAAVQPVERVNGTLRLQVQDEHHAEWLRSRVYAQLSAEVAGVFGEGVKIEFVTITPQVVSQYAEYHPDIPGVTGHAPSIWHAALGELQLQMTKATFDTWVRPTRALGWQDGRLFVGVHSPYAKEWLEYRLQATVQRTVTGIVGSDIEVQYVVAERDPRKGTPP